MEERFDLKHALAEALPDAPPELLGEVARAATLSKEEAKRILDTHARNDDAMDDEALQRGLAVIEKRSTVTA